ncbi:LysR family transcriptional regulator [Nocardia fluminea]|uniref:LysR family transcriptional regulator n=1 Tax=Nocardia fluminea TaxID=134984 RepID=UPI00366EAB55
MELRQLQYFATLGEELHFGHAAAREHIVQSALSQQIRRLERELGVPLLERSTHHVRLTPAGEVFLAEVRQILERIDRAKAAARCSTASSSAVRAATADACFDTMPQILHAAQRRSPKAVIHRFESGVPEQCKMLAEGRIDVGIGRAAGVPPQICSELVRQDPMGVLISRAHHLAELGAVPLESLAGERIVAAPDSRAPEFNEFVAEMCRAAGFTPALYPGTASNVRAAADLVAEQGCVLCLPQSCGTVHAQTVWLPLAAPLTYYPWSLLWRADDASELVQVIRDCARALGAKLGWLPADGAEVQLVTRHNADGDHIR